MPCRTGRGASSHRPKVDKGAVAMVSAGDSHEVAAQPDFVAVPHYGVEAADFSVIGRVVASVSLTRRWLSHPFTIPPLWAWRPDRDNRKERRSFSS